MLVAHIEGFAELLGRVDRIHAHNRVAALLYKSPARIGLSDQSMGFYSMREIRL